MRKNDVRKWIHATLDLLPLLVIPIFALAVRSDNNYQPIEITTGGYETISKYETNEVSSFDDLVVGNLYHCDTWQFYDVQASYSYSTDFEIYLVKCDSFAFHEYIFETDDNDIDLSGFEIDNFNCVLAFSSYNGQYYVAFTFYNDNGFYAYQSLKISDGYTYADTLHLDDFDFYVDDDYSLNNFIDWTENNCDSTFTSSDFNVYEVVYNEGKVYNDTDVGSQLVYTLYRTVDNYFNFNNVFSFNQIYDWLTVNIFGGNAPLSAFIVWNIFLYEFLMDLIFLLYALFMFFIDMCTNLIDRFTCSASGRSLK